MVLKSADGEVIEELGEAIGWQTNNVAEYRALITGLALARKHGATRLEVFMDSLLVVQQLRGLFKVKNKGLIPLYREAAALVGEFEAVRLHAVPRAENVRADELVNEALDSALSEGSIPPPVAADPKLF